MKYKNVIFDCGQVLVRFDPTEITRCYLTNEDEIKAVEEVVFCRPKPWAMMDEDSLSVDEAKQYFKEVLPDERLSNAAARIVDNWMFNLPVISGAQELVDRLYDNGVRIFLISNINMTFADRCMQVPKLASLFEKFEGLVFSAKEALVKPNVKIYERFLKRYDLRGEDCIFVDDTKENLDGAAKAGINGYLFDGDHKKLAKYLFEEE